MKYLIGARWWNESIQNDFGDERPIPLRDLTGDEVVALIRKHGRASITPASQDVFNKNSEAEFTLKFENDYD